MATTHLRVQWDHQQSEDPTVIHSEVVDGWERRKTHEFADGRLDWADATRETADTGLGIVAVGTVEAINAQPGFTATVITADEFEAVWNRAVAAG